jgi:putative DNA primase/helicase
MNAVLHQLGTPSALLDRIERNVPRVLLDLPVWLLHTADKVPMYADGRRRQGKLDSQEDRTRLVTFNRAAAATLVHDVAGLGVALGHVPDTNVVISGIDIDHCYHEGKLDERAHDILSASNSYTEKSPSGEGLHILGIGDVGTIKTRDGTLELEIYSGGRYFTVTGDAVSRKGFSEIADAAMLARKLFERPRTAIQKDETGVVHAGGRNNFLTREAGKLRRIDLDSAALAAALHALNQQRCVPALADAEVDQIAQGILRYPSHPSGMDHSGAVQLVRGTEFNPEPVSWLWNGWLARGKLHVLAGAPGCGKTTIALAIAAIVTAGKCWPDQTCAPPGNVLIWSGEDDFNDTLLPRLIAMGVDRSRIYFVGGVTTADGQQRPFDPSSDMDSLYNEARKIGDISLLIVDPIVNAVAGDSHKNSETRRSLQPLVDLATRLNAAVLGISHYTKNTQGRDPVERVTGSIAFGALPRIIMGAAKSPCEDGGTDRILVRAKSNIGPDGGGYAYSISQDELRDYPEVVASSVVWGAPLYGSAQALLATAENVTDGEERTALAEAEDFLRSELAGADILSKDLAKRSREAGISERTLKRAKQSLRIRAHKDGTTGSWYCSLPPSFPDASTEGQGSAVENLGILGPVTSNNDLRQHEETHMTEEVQGGQESQEGQEGQSNGVASLLNSERHYV